MSRIRNTLLAVVVAAMGLSAAGCDQEPTAAAGPPPAGPPEVGVMEVQPESLTLTTELPGRTAPHLIAEVRPQVGGIIQERLFIEGSDVEKGQVLYQIDPATFRAALASAEAALAKAEANVIPVRLKEERFRELVEVKAVSRQDYDEVRAALRQAEAEVEASKAAVEAARINLDYTSIKAPISGRIGRSAVTTGALVTAGQGEPLATIQQLDPIYVDVTQSSTDLLRLKRNLASGLLKSSEQSQAKVKLLLEDGTSYVLAGTLKFSEVTVNPSTGSVTLRTVFPNPDQLLLPGMFVRAIVEEGVNEAAILVPQRGVTRNPSGSAMVMVVNADEKVEPRVIQVARTVGDQWLVREGLQAGDRVILEGLQKARPGTPVKAVPFGAPVGAPQIAAKQ